MASFYVVMNPADPDIVVKTYMEMLTCLMNDKTRKAYLYCKAPDGKMKPTTVFKMVGEYPTHTTLSVFECPNEYLTYPIETNSCIICGWLHMQGSTCMNCDWVNDYSCPDCGVNTLQSTCSHMCPSWADF
jgi:hypothetical protein